MALQLGDEFVDFSLPNQNGEIIHFNDLKGAWVLLFVYPKDDTPGCTIESRAFSDNLEQFKELNTKVFGISADDVNSHKDFVKKYDLKMDLLADPDGHLLGALGVKQSEFQGAKYWDRTSFLINPSGMLKKVYLNVNPKGHEEQVLNDIKALASE